MVSQFNGFRRTQSTFKFPQNLFIDSDDYYMTAEEISKTKYVQGFRSTKDLTSVSGFFRQTNKELKFQPNQTNNNLRDVTINLTDPVFRLKVDKIMEANVSVKPSKSQQLSQTQLHQQFTMTNTQSNKHITTEQSNLGSGKKLPSSNKLALGAEEGGKSFISKKDMSMTQSMMGSGSRQMTNSQISYQQPLPDYYSFLPHSIQQKHQIAHLLTQVEQNSKQLGDYKYNNSALEPIGNLTEESEIKYSQETIRKTKGVSSTKWYKPSRKPSNELASILNQREFKSGGTGELASYNNSQSAQRITTQNESQYNFNMNTEESVFGKKSVDPLTDSSLGEKHLTSYTEGDEPMRSFQPDVTFTNNNPFLPQEDLNITVNNQGEELLIIKIPNLMNYKVQPLELFDSQLSTDPDPESLIRDGSIRAFSRWVLQDGGIVWRDCEILKYNKTTKRFYIKWISNSKTKEVSRLNLMYEWENEEDMNNRNKMALKKREQLLYYMGMKIFISEEGTTEKSILFSKLLLRNILDKVFNSKDMRKHRKLKTKVVTEEVLEMFKYEVIKFACEIHTVPSLPKFFEAYFPDSMMKAKKIMLDFNYLINSQSYPARLQCEDIHNKNRQHSRISIKTSISPKRKETKTLSETEEEEEEQEEHSPTQLQKQNSHNNYQILLKNGRASKARISAVQQSEGYFSNNPSNLNTPHSVAMSNKNNKILSSQRSSIASPLPNTAKPLHQHHNSLSNTNSIVPSVFSNQLNPNPNISVHSNNNNASYHNTSGNNINNSSDPNESNLGANADQQAKKYYFQKQRKQIGYHQYETSIENPIAKQALNNQVTAGGSAIMVTDQGAQQEEKDNSDLKSFIQVEDNSYNNISQTSQKKKLLLNKTCLSFKSRMSNHFQKNFQSMMEDQSRTQFLEDSVTHYQITDYEFIKEDIYEFDYLRLKEVQPNEPPPPVRETKAARLQRERDRFEKISAKVHTQKYAIPQPYFEFLISKLSPTFYFSTEDKNCVFNKIVPGILIFDMQSHNQKRNQAEPKKNPLWPESFYKEFTGLAVKVLQSHFIHKVRTSLLDLNQRIKKYFASIPFEFLEQDFGLEHIYNAFLESQLACSLKNLEYEAKQKEKKSTKPKEKEDKSDVKFKKIKEGKQLNFSNDEEIKEKKKGPSLNARKSVFAPFLPPSPQNSIIQKEEIMQQIMEEAWPCFQEAKIIYLLYKQLVNFLLTDNFTHAKFQQIDKKPIQPLYKIKAKFLSEKIPAEKKQLENICKRINFKRLQDLGKMEEVIDNGREKFWRFTEMNVGLKEMFQEVAKRNFEEIDPTTFQDSIKDKTISIKKMGWFNMSCFTVVYDPPITEFEQSYKASFQDAIQSICQVSTFYKKDPLLKMEDIQEELKSLLRDSESFLTNGFYGLYSFFLVLQRFEFYILFSHKYERYLQKRVDSDELEAVFSEIDKMESDFEFMKVRMVDEMNLGIFLIDTIEYKETLMIEIRSKVNFAKKIMREKFQSSIEHCMQLGDKILAKMQDVPKTVRDYIKLNLYLQGDELKADFQTILKLISIGQNIIDKQQILLIEISSEDIYKIISAEMLNKEVQELKYKKDAKQEHDRPKYIRMHLEEKEKVKVKIDEIKEKVEQIRNITTFDKVEQQSRESEVVINQLYDLRQQVRQLQQDGLNLDQGFDQEIDIEKITEDFENYQKIWQFAHDWLSKKQIWLFKPLISTSTSSQSMQTVDIKEISYTLEKGNRILREVEPFFAVENPNILPLIDAINIEISGFQSVYELLVQVKDESFKTQHWHQIFDFVYDKNEEKRKRMKRMNDPTELNLHTLIVDGILEFIQSIKVIAVEAKDEFKSQQSVNYIEQEFSNQRFQLLNYFSIFLITDIRSIIDRLRHEEFKVGELLRNKVYQKNEYLEKLRRIEHFVKHTRKVLKIIAKIQDNILKYAPIFRFKESEQKYKGIELLFRKVVQEFKKHTEEITKRGMVYFLNLFSLDSLDQSNQIEIFEIFSQINLTAEKMEAQVYHIINAVRQTHPRYAFVSDEFILEISQTIFFPTEFLGRVQLIFPGVKEFKCISLNSDINGDDNNWEINQIINFYDEVIELPSSIPYVLKYLEKPPNMGTVNQIESEIKKYMKQQIIYNIKPIAAKNFNYWKIWNMFLVKKLIIFQTFYLINDILFIHDLTLLLSLEKKYQDLQRFHDHLKENYEEFVAYYQQVQVAGTSYSQTIQFTQALIQIQQHIDIIESIMKTENYSINSFEYLILPKFTIQIPIDESGQEFEELIGNTKKQIQESLEIKKKEDEERTAAAKALQNRQPGNKSPKNMPVMMNSFSTASQGDLEVNSSGKMPAIAYKSEYLSQIKKRPNQMEIYLMCFFHKVSYGFELVPMMNNFVFTESVQRLIHQAVTSISGNFGCIVKGGSSIGKKTIIKTMATILGRSIFECNFARLSPRLVESILLNAASSNYWLNITSVEIYSVSILSLMSNILFHIRKAVALGNTQFSYANKYVEVAQYHGFFLTMNMLPIPFDTSFASFPKSLSESFRILTFLKPDFIEVVKSYLEILGFGKDEAIMCSKRLIYFVEFLSTVSNNQQYTYQKKLTYSDFQQIINQRSDKQQRLLSLKSIMVILRNALLYQQENKRAFLAVNGFRIALRVSIDNYFKGIMPSTAFKYMKNLFSKLFPWASEALSQRDQSDIVRIHRESIPAFFEHHLYSFQIQFSEQSLRLLPLVLKSFPLIVYGQHSSKKNMFIELLSYLTSIIKDMNFNVNFLNIDSILPSTLFNTKMSETPASDSFVTSNEKQPGEKSNTKETGGNNNSGVPTIDAPEFLRTKKGILNMLIDTMRYELSESRDTINQMLGIQSTFCTYVANSITEKLKVQNNLAPRSMNDWIIVDGCAECMNETPQTRTVELLLDGFESRSFTFEEGDILTVPNTVTTIFQFEKLQNISPSSFNKYMLCFFSNQVISLQDEFMAWYREKLKQNAFFFRFHVLIKSLYAYILEPYFKLIDEIPSSNLIFPRSEKGALKAFLDYLEIFMNEIRKFEIAIGEYEVDGMANIPSNNLRRERKHHLTSSVGICSLSPAATARGSISKGGKMKFPQNLPITEESAEEDENDNSNQGKEDHQVNYDPQLNDLSYNTIALETDLRLVAQFEAVFVFSLTWSLANQFKQEYLHVYTTFLKDAIEKYCKYRVEHTKVKYTEEQYPFATDFRTLLKDHDMHIFEYVYDIHKIRWIKWKNFSFEECSEMSGTFDQNNISNREIVRLNPLAISVVNTKLTQEKKEMYIPENILFIETHASKVAKYFIQHFASYEKPFILLAQSQNGASTIIRNKLKSLQEYHQFSCVYLSISKGTSISNFQRRIEKNLVWKDSNHLTSIHQTTCLIVVDDLNLAKDGISPIGALRSFVQHNGWYSNNKNKYVCFSQVSFLGVFSYFDLHKVYTKCHNVLFEKFAYLKMPQISETDLVSIFQQYNYHSCLPKSHADRLTLGAISDFCSMLALMGKKYQKQFQKISKQFNANLSLRKGLQIVQEIKSFQLYNQTTKMIDPVNLVRTLVFMINQIFSSEFIHNPCMNSIYYKTLRSKAPKIEFQIHKPLTEEDNSFEASKGAEIPENQRPIDISSDSESIIESCDSSQMLNRVPSIEESDAASSSDSYERRSKFQNFKQSNRKTKFIKNKLTISNLSEVKSIAKASQMTNDQKVLWLLGEEEAPPIVVDDKQEEKPQIIEQLPEIVVEEEQKKGGNKISHKKGKNSSQFKTENKNHHKSEKSNTLKASQEKDIFDFKEASVESSDKSDLVEEKSDSDFAAINFLVPPPPSDNKIAQDLNEVQQYGYLGGISQLLLPVPQNIIDNNIEEIIKQQLHLENERDAIIEEKRYVAQDKKTNNSHVQTSRDVTNAQKLSFFESQFITHDSSQKLHNHHLIKEMVNSMEFVFSSLKTVPDQFTMELTYSLACELMKISAERAKQETAIDAINEPLEDDERPNFSNILINSAAKDKVQSKQPEIFNQEIWESILKQRQDLLFFNTKLMSRDNYIRKVSNLPVSQKCIYVSNSSKRIQLAIEMFDDKEFQFLEEKKQNLVFKFLLHKLIVFCFTVPKNGEYYLLTPLIGGKDQQEKFFEDFNSQQQKRLSKKQRSDSADSQKSNGSNSSPSKRFRGKGKSKMTSLQLAAHQSVNLDALSKKLSSNFAPISKQQSGLLHSAGSFQNLEKSNQNSGILMSPLIPSSSQIKESGKNYQQLKDLFIGFTSFEGQVSQVSNFLTVMPHDKMNQSLGKGWTLQNMNTKQFPRMDLLDTLLIQEVSLSCFLTHVIKILHLLQSQAQNIYLKSSLSSRLTQHAVSFSCELCDLKIFEFQLISQENPLQIQKRFSNTLFTAIQNLFLEERTIIIYIKLSNYCITTTEQQESIEQQQEQFLASNQHKDQHVQRLDAMQQLFDIIHHILEGGEISSLFSQSQIEALMLRWKMKMKYPGFNNYILNYIFALRMKNLMRFILHEELSPRTDTALEYLQNEFSHMLEQFNKYNFYYIPLKNEKIKYFQNILYQQIFNQLPRYLNSKHRILVMQTYSKEQEVSKVYEDSWKNNLQRTYEETFSLFFLTRNVVRHSLRAKIERVRRKGGFLKIIQEMEKKQVTFQDEIVKAEEEFAKAKESKKTLIKSLSEAQKLYTELKQMQDGYGEKEKQINELIQRCLIIENQFRSVQQSLIDTSNKICKLQKNSWNDEIRPQQLVQIKQMTIYILIFFIGLHRTIPEKYNVSMQQLADDVVDGIAEINKNSMNINNIELYREKFLHLLSDSDEFKNTITSFREEHVKKNTFDLFKCLNKEGGSADHAYMVSLTGNMNIHQREIVKYADMLLEVYRIALEVRNLGTNSQEQKEKLRVVREEKEKHLIDKKMSAPLQTMRETPIQIEKLKKEQRVIMGHIVEKKNGYQQFQIQLEKFKDQYKYLVLRETCEFTSNNFMNEIATQIALSVAFLLKYPYYVRNKFEELIADKLSKSDHLKNIKLYNALFSTQAYFEIIRYKIPYNQDLINKIILIDFLYQFDLFYYVFILDKTGSYLQYLTRKYGKQLIVENCTNASKESYQNIEKAVVEGQVLALKNSDLSTLEIVMPLIEWKYRRMMKLLRFFIQRSKQEGEFAKKNKDSIANVLKHDFVWTDDEVFNFNEKTRKEEPLTFNNKTLVVHKNFKLFCISADTDATYSHSLFNKIVFMQIDIEEETFWKQSIFDHLINQINFERKSALITQKLDEINGKREAMGNIFTTISVQLQMCTTCEDTEFLKNFNETGEQLKTQIGMKDAQALKISALNLTQSDDEKDLGKKRIIKEIVQIGLPNSSSAQKKLQKIEFEEDDGKDEAINQPKRYLSQKASLPDEEKRIEDLMQKSLEKKDGGFLNIDGEEDQIQERKRFSSMQIDRESSQNLDSPKSQKNIVLSKKAKPKRSSIKKQTNMLQDILTQNNTSLSLPISQSQEVPSIAINSFNEGKNLENDEENDNNAFNQPPKLALQLISANNSNDLPSTSRSGVTKKKRKVLEIKTAKEKQKEKTFKSIVTNYPELDEIVEEHQYLLFILDFLYAIKLNYSNLEKALGNVYSFSDSFFFMLISQACAKCIILKLIPQPPKPKPSKQKFVKRFSEIVYHLLYSSMAEDHRVIFGFYLSMMYARGTNSFSEEEWRTFLTWTTPALEYYDDLDQNLFAFPPQNESKKQKKQIFVCIPMEDQLKGERVKWMQIYQQMIQFFHLPNNIIAPMQPYQVEKTLLEKFQEKKEQLKAEEAMNPYSQQQNKPSSLIASLFLKKVQTDPNQNLSPRSNDSSHNIQNDNQSEMGEVSQFDLSAVGSNSTDRSRRSSLSLLSLRNVVHQHAQEQIQGLTKRTFNPLLAKFQERELELPIIYIDGDQLADTQGILSPQKKIMPQLGGKLNAPGSKGASQFQFAAKKQAFEIDYKRYKPQAIMSHFGKKFLNPMGKDVLERFLTSYPHFQDKKNMKRIINTFIDQQEKWINFQTNSLTDFIMTEEEKREVENEREKFEYMASDEEEEEEKEQEQQLNQGSPQLPQKAQLLPSQQQLLQKQTSQSKQQLQQQQISSQQQPPLSSQQATLRTSKHKQDGTQKIDTIKMIPFIPKEIMANCSFLQILFIFKHFRPDFIPQAAEYSSQRILRGYIDFEQAPVTIEIHCQEDWQKRPTILLHNEVQNKLFEALELLQNSVNPDCSLLRLSVGCSQIRYLIDQINQAAGAGRWVLLEEVEEMEGEDLKQLLRALDHELEASTTTKSFRVWISHNASGGNISQLPSFKPFSFSKNNTILSNYYQSCWKIYYSSPKNIQQAMQRYFYREIHDFSHKFETTKQIQAQGGSDKINSSTSVQNSKTKSTEEEEPLKCEKEIILKKGTIVGNVVQLMRRYQIFQGLTPFPLNSTAHEKYYQNQSVEYLATLGTQETSKTMNIFSFTDKGEQFIDHSKAAQQAQQQAQQNHSHRSPHQNPLATTNLMNTLNNTSGGDDTRSNYAKFYKKLQFSLAFLHCCMGTKREKTNGIQKSYDTQLSQTPSEQRESDLDFQQSVNGVFTLLQYFPHLNLRQFLESYIKTIYKISNPYYLSMLLHFVFSSMESTLKLKIKNYTYLIYDFNSGIFEYYEEGISKIISDHFPSCTDPLDLFFAGLNNQVLHDYVKSKQFMHKIILIEREWKQSRLTKSLKYLNRLKREEREFRLLEEENMSNKKINDKIYANSMRNVEIKIKSPDPPGKAHQGISLEIPKRKSSMNKEDNPFILTEPNQTENVKKAEMNAQDNNQENENSNQKKEDTSPSNLNNEAKLVRQHSNPQAANLFFQFEFLSDKNKEEQLLIDKIGYQAKSFFKIYYRNLLQSNQSNSKLIELLETWLSALDYEFRLKEIPFIKYRDNVRGSRRTAEEIPLFINQWVSSTQFDDSIQDLVQFKSAKKQMIHLARATMMPFQFSSPSLSPAPGQRNSAPFMTPQMRQSLPQQRIIGQMNVPSIAQSPTKLNPLQRKASFADKMRLTRFEATIAGQLLELEKKNMQKDSFKKDKTEKQNQLNTLQSSEENEVLIKKKNPKKKEDEERKSGSNSSNNSSDDSESGDEDQTNVEKSTFKSSMLNESVLLYRVILQIKQDIKSVIDQINNKFENQQIGKKNHVSLLKEEIENNILPEAWRKLSFKVAQRNLTNFLQILFMKIHYSRSIISKGIAIQMPIVIHLDRLVDPFSFLGSYLYNLSQARNIDIIDLKLFLEKVSTADIQKQQAADGGFYVKGIFLNNGSLNKENQFLIDEETRQFQYEFPVYQIQGRKKSRLRPEVYHKSYDPIISIELNDSDYIVSRYDMENEYAFQKLHPIKLYNYDATSDQKKETETDSLGAQMTGLMAGKGKKKSVTNPLMVIKPKTVSSKKIATGKITKEQESPQESLHQNKAEDEANNINSLSVKELNFSELHNQQNYNFVVKIPFKNPCTASSYSSLQSKFYLFFNSRKPQDYWDMRGTHVTSYKHHL